ncbi:hypothetical protein Bbelb_021190 [Branchiostoma belcheri]|nr:hypothetical protein Bbelb_021190 [Branchiostoma belcheri]
MSHLYPSSTDTFTVDVQENLHFLFRCSEPCSVPLDASRSSVPFAVTSRLFALFVSHIGNKEIDAMHTHFPSETCQQVFGAVHAHVRRVVPFASATSHQQVDNTKLIFT